MVGQANLVPLGLGQVGNRYLPDCPNRTRIASRGIAVTENDRERFVSYPLHVAVGWLRNSDTYDFQTLRRDQIQGSSLTAANQNANTGRNYSNATATTPPLHHLAAVCR